MVKREAEGSAGPEAMVGLTWDELARLGAPRLLQAALAAAVSAYVAAHQGGARCTRPGHGGAHRPGPRAEGDERVWDADGAGAARGCSPRG
jgi:hypothetical protein